jgi:hypothetical protein
MNVFHAVQYLALVWAVEGRRISSILRLPSGSLGSRIGACLFLLAVLLYGLSAQLLITETGWLWSLTIVVSLMHFWYDGFVWSVRQRQL